MLRGSSAGARRTCTSGGTVGGRVHVLSRSIDYVPLHVMSNTNLGLDYDEGTIRGTSFPHYCQAALLTNAGLNQYPLSLLPLLCN